MSGTESLWYKDAIFYEVYVRGFYDANGDGDGDLIGLTSKLDYLQELGVDCLWLMPIYASPLKDDGYDIADFRQIHPTIGTVSDFETLTKDAHARGIRIIADLVVNHTSDQHPWFQEARRDPTPPSGTITSGAIPTRPTRAPGSSSGTRSPPTGRGTRSPASISGTASTAINRTSTSTTRTSSRRCSTSWPSGSTGGSMVSGSTPCPTSSSARGRTARTSPRRMSSSSGCDEFVDTHYPGTLLLAEANQWPSDLLPYFGNGDEFHMAFNFPLMPRLFMAIRREDQRPITEIMSQMPEIPCPASGRCFCAITTS